VFYSKSINYNEQRVFSILKLQGFAKSESLISSGVEVHNGQLCKERAAAKLVVREIEKPVS